MSRLFKFIIFCLLIHPYNTVDASLATKARICAVKGTVYISTGSTDTPSNQQKKCPLNQSLDKTQCKVVNQSTRIETGSDGYAIIEYANGHSIKVAPNTIVVVSRESLYVESGKTWIKINKMSNGELEIRTPKAIAGIRGTEFLTHVSANGETNFQLIEGEIIVSDIDKKSTLGMTAGIQVFIPGQSTDFDTETLKPDEEDKWWTDWPKIVPLNTDQPNNYDTEVSNQQYPVADSHVYEYSYRNWNNSNWGKYHILGSGWNPTGGEKRTYIKFDVSQIKANDFEQAYLRLYHYHTSGNNNDFSLSIHAVTEDWNEGNDTYHSGQNEKTANFGEISWKQQPSFDFDPVTSFTPGHNVNHFIKINITPLVKAWLTGKTNNGLVIKPSGKFSEAQYSFYAREYSEAAKRPVLIFE